MSLAIMEATEVAVIKPLKKPSESMRGIGKDTKKKLKNLTAAELLEKMRRQDEEEL